MKSTIKIAIVGVGNCASSLVQGIEYYQHQDSAQAAGLIHPEIGGYRLEDVEVVAAFDVDHRKVGRPLHEAVFARPNCTTVFQRELPETSVIVQMGPVLDGIADHMDRVVVRFVEFVGERLVLFIGIREVTKLNQGVTILVCHRLHKSVQSRFSINSQSAMQIRDDTQSNGPL